MADIKRKLVVRKGQRNMADKRMGEVTAVLGAGVIGEPEKAKLVQLKLALEEKLGTLKRLDEEILALIQDEADVLLDIEEADSYTQRIYEQLVSIDSHVNSAPAVTTGVAVAASMASSGIQAKLPKLSLPIFNGDVTDWPTFWDSFEVAVHKNATLSEVEKFTYLRSLVSKGAKDTISGLALTAANYGEAIALLESRYGNKERIISKHMEVLLNIESVTWQGNTHALRALYDKVETNLRALKALGVPPEAYNSLLPSLILKKLPQELCLTISRKLKDVDWKLDEIMRELGEELQARERAAAEGRKPGFEHNRSRKGVPGTAATLFTGNASCCFCKQSHASESCKSIADPGARQQILRELGRCFLCLRRGHMSRACRQNTKCSKCGGKHHVSICFRSENESKASGSKSGEKTLDPKAEPFKSASLFVDNHGTVLLQTARANCFNLEKSECCVNLRIAFDSGSQYSYITERACASLELRPTGKHNIRIVAFGNNSNCQNCNVVRLGIESKEKGVHELSLLTVPIICEPLSGSNVSQKSLRAYPHLADLEFADSTVDGEIINLDILVGLDFYWSFITGEVIKGREGPIAVYSSLGWILSGPVCGTSSALVTHTLRTEVQSISGKTGLNEQLKKFWELESLGISEEEKSLYDQFKANVTFNGERYQVTLPWKDTFRLLPDNYHLSLKRLNGLLRRLRQQPVLFEEYNRVIKEQIAKGIVEIVEDPNVVCGERVHYLPHHAVIRRDKETTKVRVVFDASAKTTGLSLNECLHVGPKFNQHIMDILLRFRLNKCAFIADIEKAFLMIAVAEHDRDVLRFLWIDDMEKSSPIIKVLRFARVTFGVVCSPFLLNATVKHHIEKCSEAKPAIAAKLINSMYVDDVVCGASDCCEAVKLYEEFKAMLMKGGFNLRKFVCNAADEDSSPGEQRVLGLRWDINQDEFVMDLSEVVKSVNEKSVTKREIISIGSSIFDPLGFISPVTIKVKLLFQELHRSKIGWDDIITGDLLQQWCNVLCILRESEVIRVPRWCLRDCENSQFRLCGFSDASMRAYAAVVYLQIDGARMMFLASKTRVAPLSSVTVPRLELLGTLLLARLVKSISEALKTELKLLPAICYTDSQVALCWIVGDNKEWKPFVENRVKEIRRLVPVEQWKYCPGKDNPADLPTRGVTTKELISDPLWFYGPSQLEDTDSLQYFSQGPIGGNECGSERVPIGGRESEGESVPIGGHESESESVPIGGHECGSESVPIGGHESESVPIGGNECGSETVSSLFTCQVCNVSSIIDAQRYSTIEKLIKVTGFVLKFIDYLKNSVHREGINMLPWQLKAECMWVRECQSEFVSMSEFGSLKKQLQLFEDKENIWRCGGRLKNAELSYSSKHPIVLPSKHYFTELVIKRAHKRVYHNGIKETLTEVRSMYWIIRGRARVKQFIYNCIVCKRLEGKHYGVPAPPPLPAFRVREAPPFSNTGVDFAGPLFIKEHRECDSKVWVCLFTCCVTRAIHLDIVNNMSVQSFIRCFRRFAARRGLPNRMMSDNAKTFKGAAKIIGEVMKHPDVHRYLEDFRVKWVFNVEKAPWWGGIFERLIQSVKRCLRKSIGRAKLNLEELTTIIIEVEMIINSRPLTYVSQGDLEEPITPSHLLIGRRLLNLPECLLHEEDEDEDYNIKPQLLAKRMRHMEEIMSQFWKRWKLEYLIELREAHRFGPHGVTGRSISVGDIVIIHNEDKRRGFWKLGQVKEIITGCDGQNRGAIIRVFSGNKSKLLRRPVQRLYPLEVRESQPEGQLGASSPIEDNTEALTDHIESGMSDSRSESSNQASDTISEKEQEVPAKGTRRSGRAASSRARDRILAHLMQ